MSRRYLKESCCLSMFSRNYISITVRLVGVLPFYGKQMARILRISHFFVFMTIKFKLEMESTIRILFQIGKKKKALSCLYFS